MTIDPYEMSREEFLAALKEKTTPEILWENAQNPYSFLSGLFGVDCTDSVLREWAFQWWQEETGREYEEIYYRWLDNAHRIGLKI